MKKLLVFLFAIVIGTAFAETINVNWKVGDTTYSTSTCESGGNLIIPQTPPTKYGYTFVGWNYGVITGTWSQSGTPTPTNPIEPVFYQLGDTVLRALGSGENFVADEYNPSTEKITRRVGVLILNGTEGWSAYEGGGTNGFRYDVQNLLSGNWLQGLSSHYKLLSTFPTSAGDMGIRVGVAQRSPNIIYFLYGNLSCPYSDIQEWKNFLIAQYNAGTPVTVYYPLAEPVEESWSLSE